MSKVIAVIAAHPDDEVLGCGGTIARMASEGYSIHVLLMSDGETSRSDVSKEFNEQRLKHRNSSALNACKMLGCASVEQLTLPDNKMDSMPLLDVIKLIEVFINEYRPNIVFTHHSGDVNVDHRIIHDAVIAACRPQPDFFVRELFFFEVPSSTEWRPPSSSESFSPNCFVDISDTLEIKLRALGVYKSELRTFPHSRSLKAVEALATWRGATVGVNAAEAFIIGRKLI